MGVVEPKAVARHLSLFIWLLFAAASLSAEQLPIKTYTTADGLAGDNTTRIVRDSRGFLWLCTEEGLSRFDGYQFTNYTVNEGLPHRWVSDLLETHDGHYWVASGGGVSRFNPAGTPLFSNYHPSSDERSWKVEVLIEDGDGVIWCGTDGGLYRMEEMAGQPRFEFVDMGMPTDAEGQVAQALVVDRKRSLWVATRGSGLYRRWPNGRVDHYTTRQGLPANRVETLLEDRDGQLWVGTTRGVIEVSSTPDPNQSLAKRVYTKKEGLPSDWVENLFQTADGRIWLSTDVGLSEFNPALGGTGDQFRTYTTANGLSSKYVTALAEDGDGNLWLGTDSGGVMKVTRTGFTTYTEADGLGAAGVDAIFEGRAAELFAISSFTKHFINQFDGRRFKAIWPNFPRRINNFGWGWNQVTLQDHAGEWWVPTGEGLCRFPAVAHFEQLAQTPPKMIYTTRDGLPFDEVFRLFEDSRGDIWISTLSAADNGLSRWERSMGKLHTFSAAEGLTSLKMNPVTAFAEDAAGNIWLGHLGGGLSCFRDRRFQWFAGSDGLPAGSIRSLYLDREHRLWVASALGGLARLDNPMDPRPHVITYTTSEGLSSNDVWCVSEDLWGHIYVGTGRGLDRLDLETGHVKHFTAADGLLVGKVTSAFRDSHGALWFASNVHGLSRLVPEADPPQLPPPILINGLRIAGVVHPISQLGETEISQLELSPNQNQLNIDFVGLSFGSGEALRYQYQLEGADQKWSELSDRRSVNYANLAPGRYRFLVRAVNAEGLASASPATVVFTISPPVWRRWWFLALAAFFVGLAVFTVHRQRVGRLVELERVRTRIATDLHDDIGANLSLIAMLSEVARGQLQRDDVRLKEWFSTIAATSRDTVDAMSDIVWAVNPKRDHVRDLTRRMRRFADDILAARNIELQFKTPEASLDLKLGADLRREIFLIFKESINNIARHSECSVASVGLYIEAGWLVLKMTDDGRGIDEEHIGEGTGLHSMQQRAQKLGGSFEVSSQNGNGTTVALKVPLDQSKRL